MDEYIFKNDEFKLREITLDDAEPYFESMQSDEAREGFMSLPSSLKEAISEIEEKLEGMSFDKRTHETYAIEVSGEYAGYVEVNSLHAQFSEHKGGVGYCIHPKFFKKGLASKALKALTEYVFDKYNYLVRLTGHTRDFNVGSRKVMERAGYVHEGTLMKNKLKNGEYLNDMVFSFVR